MSSRKRWDYTRQNQGNSSKSGAHKGTNGVELKDKKDQGNDKYEEKKGDFENHDNKNNKDLLNNNDSYKKLKKENEELKGTLKNNEIILEKKSKEIERLERMLKANESKYELSLYGKEKEINELKTKMGIIEKIINEIKEEYCNIKEENNQLQKSLLNEKNKNSINTNLIKENEIIVNKFKKIEEIILNKNFQIKSGEERKEVYGSNVINSESFKRYGIVGIDNKELNCYMSSVIQILKNLKYFSVKFLESKTEDSIVKSLQKLITNLYYSKEKYISILEFKKEFGYKYKKFEGVKNNDSTLFLIYLLQHLHKDFNNPNSNLKRKIMSDDLDLKKSEIEELNQFLNKNEAKNNSFIYDIFFGYQINKIVCSGCNNSQVSYQIFNILDLPLMDENSRLKSLEECLNCYFITKDQKGKPGFDCSKCKKKLLSYLTNIIKFPKILIINLKRVGEKYIYLHEIKIPFILKTDLIDKLNHINKTFELIGFVKHLGNENDGHNVAYSRNIFDRKWFYFNDTDVKEIEGNPSTEKAFLLFYQLIAEE